MQTAPQRYRTRIYLVTAIAGLVLGISAGLRFLPGHGAHAPVRIDITVAATTP